MFVYDRDLLVLEPNLFRDVSWTGQRLLEGTGTIEGTTLTIPGADAAAAGVTAGHVAVVGGVALEVVERLSATELTVSRWRGSMDEPAIPPAPAAAQPVTVTTFRPQTALIHAQVLRMLGLEAADEGEIGAGPTEADVTNPRDLWLVEALGVLHLVYAAASALSPPDSPLALRAGMYRERYAGERQWAGAQVDLDGDGLADATRRMSVMQLVRG